MGDATCLEELLVFLRNELEVLDGEVDVGEVQVDSVIADLDLESVTLLSLVAALENRYGIRFSEQERARVRTVGQLLTLTAERADEYPART